MEGSPCGLFPQESADLFSKTLGNELKACANPGIRQVCILSLCLFNLYAEYILRNAGLDEAQAGIKIAGRNSNNLRYANDTTHMAEREEELKSLLMKVKKEPEKVGLKLNIQKNKIMASSPITSHSKQMG